MTQKSVLVTGASGGIGSKVCRLYGERGWRVVATDHSPAADLTADQFIALDLERLAKDEQYCEEQLQILRAAFPDGLHCLVNNAAHQHVAPAAEISAAQWQTSFSVNVTSPFLLVTRLIEPLRAARGSVINISSVHTRLTKPGFAAYASSKAALEGLTRALAVELGDSISVNAIAPAAIDTPMLRAGFDSNNEAMNQLESFHPSASIGRPEDVAKLCLYIAEAEAPFLNGSVIGLDGGIASRLHDPA